MLAAEACWSGNGLSLIDGYSKSLFAHEHTELVCLFISKIDLDLLLCRLKRLAYRLILIKDAPIEGLRKLYHRLVSDSVALLHANDVARPCVLENFACKFTVAGCNEDKLQVCVRFGDDLLELFLINLDSLAVLFLQQQGVEGLLFKTVTSKVECKRLVREYFRELEIGALFLQDFDVAFGFTE